MKQSGDREGFHIINYPVA